MDNIKKALNWLVISILVSTVAIVVGFATGFVDLSKGNVIDALWMTVRVLSLLAAVAMFVACIFGKIGNNKNFTLAFWCTIANIAMALVQLILIAARVETRGVVITFSILSTLTNIASFYFIIMACREATPAVGKLAITTAVFILVGLVLTMAVTFFKNIQSDGAVACMVIGSLVELVGLILFTVLVGKARAKYGK